MYRCLGMLLQRVNDASYVQQKLNLMDNHANFTDAQNRVGLAKALGMEGVIENSFRKGQVLCVDFLHQHAIFPLTNCDNLNPEKVIRQRNLVVFITFLASDFCNLCSLC
ncbi:hypothetical protein CY35_08G051600 [Sphagnum magellanicum]|nr:hypothetical protein CY35_08G051600 [Sphagnum magellanicum]